MPSESRTAQARRRFAGIRAAAFALLAILPAMLTGPDGATAIGFQAPGEATLPPRALEVSAVALPSPVEPGGTFRLFIRARLDPGWHIYALDQAGENTAVATRIQVEDGAFASSGPWRENDPKVAFDGALGRAIKVHRHEAEFHRSYQVPQSLPPGAHALAGSLWFRACDNKVCTMPQELGFEAAIEIEDASPPRRGN